MGEEVKSKSFRNLIIGIIVLAVVLVILFVPMIPVSLAYNETEPYDREATYVVDDWNLEEKLGFFDVYVQSDVIVRNTDKYGGTFVVLHKLYDVYGLFGSEEDSFYLGAGDSYTSTVTFDTSWGQDTLGEYSVNPPTVTDERLVTKHKTVYKSIIELLLF